MKIYGICIKCSQHPEQRNNMAEKFSNVWDALFDDPGEKAVLEIKSGLMDEIRHYLRRENLTQEKAAEVLGVSQPRISDIATGKISKFTIEELQRISNEIQRIHRNV